MKPAADQLRSRPQQPDTDVDGTPASLRGTIWQRQLTLCGLIGLVLNCVVAGLYLQDRHNEWGLRVEQAEHRLDIVSGLISRELARVQSDALYLANQGAVRQFVGGADARRAEVEAEFAGFVQRKAMYDQIRLLSMEGDETLRVNYLAGQPLPVQPSELQDKEDRYYYREALGLAPGEVFVSDLDLNLEHGQIERPLKPVIRFVTPVLSQDGSRRMLLVLNYLGAPLLGDLDATSVPGMTLLLRSDGHYLRGPNEGDAWGWVLGHERSFARQFPQVWPRLGELTQRCLLDRTGAFAGRVVSLGRTSGASGTGRASGTGGAGGVGSRAEPAATSDVAAAEASSGTGESAEQHARRDAASWSPQSSSRSSSSPLSSSPPSTELPGRDAILVLSYLPHEQVFAGSNQLLKRLLILAGLMLLPLVALARYWAHSSVNRAVQAQRIAESEARLRELSSRLLRIQEDERRAISREIHDELGQQVTAIRLDQKLAERNLDTGRAAGHLERAIAETEQLLQSLHAFATRVRPAVLDDLGLAEAVESHLWDFQKRAGIQVQTRLELPEEPLPDVIADNVYRLLQESLNNVVKHAQAQQVWVEIIALDEQNRPTAESGAEAVTLRLCVDDDGRGLPASSTENRLGIVGMRERVDLLGGTFAVGPRDSGGTRVQVDLPLRRADQTPLQTAANAAANANADDARGASADTPPPAADSSLVKEIA